MFPEKKLTAITRNRQAIDKDTNEVLLEIASIDRAHQHRVLKTQSKVIEVYQKKVCYNVDLLPLYDDPNHINSETLGNIRNLITNNLKEQIETLESIAEHTAVQNARLLMNDTVKETRSATNIMSEAGIRKILFEIFPEVISNRFDLSDQVDWVLSYDNLLNELHNLIKELPDFQKNKQLFLNDYSILGLGKQILGFGDSGVVQTINEKLSTEVREIDQAVQKHYMVQESDKKDLRRSKPDLPLNHQNIFIKKQVAKKMKSNPDENLHTQENNNSEDENISINSDSD